jgi:HEAT repeat protein
MRRCALDAAASGRFEAIESALPALEAAGAGPEVAPALVEMLLAAVRAGRPHAAELTMESLGRIAAPARRDAVRRIAELAAGTADSRSRVAACRALAVAGIDSLAAVDLLVRLLESGDPEVALAAARAFGAMDAAPAAAIPLARQLRGDVEPLLRACVLALRRTGPDAAPAAPELVALLLRADKRTFSVPHMSREVAATLGVMGERGVAGLIEILTSSQGEDVTAPAARVLAEYGAEAIPALVAALNSNGLAAKRTAVVLGDLGGDIGTAVVPALVRALDRTDIAPWAAMSLIRIGGGAEFWGEEAMDRVAREGSVGAQFDLVSMGDRLLRHGLPRTSRRAYARAMARILETGNPRAPLEGAMRNLGALGADAAEAAALVQKWVGTESDLSGAAAIASALIRGEPPPKR